MQDSSSYIDSECMYTTSKIREREKKGMGVFKRENAQRTERRGKHEAVVATRRRDGDGVLVKSVEQVIYTITQNLNTNGKKIK